jgi:hypothetical protein
MKSFILLLLSLLLSPNLFGQDTITTAVFNSKAKELNGKYVVLGLQSRSVTIIGDKRDTFIYPIRYYRVGSLKNGMQDGTWESYTVGKGHDTLFWHSIYRNDTLLLSTQYYPNGNQKYSTKYIDTRLVTSQYFLSSGKKYIEMLYMDCADEFANYEAVVMEYYGNGILKSVGKVKCINRKQTKYDTWYYYSDRGEPFRIIRYADDKKPEETVYKIKGRYYEWYEEKEK